MSAPDPKVVNLAAHRATQSATTSGQGAVRPSARRHACAAQAYEAAADPHQARLMAASLGGWVCDEAEVACVFGIEAARAWRKVVAARCAFFAACEVAP